VGTETGWVIPELHPNVMYENGDRNSQSTEICFQFYPNIKLGLFNRSHLCISQIIVHLENTVNFRSTESYFSDCFHHFPTHNHRRSFCRATTASIQGHPLFFFWEKLYVTWVFHELSSPEFDIVCFLDLFLFLRLIWLSYFSLICQPHPSCSQAAPLDFIFWLYGVMVPHF
jgi:hypothetical protein